MSKKVIIVEKITIEKAMIELDEVLEKTCDIADMLVQNYGIEINNEELKISSILSIVDFFFLSNTSIQLGSS